MLNSDVTKSDYQSNPISGHNILPTKKQIFVSMYYIFSTTCLLQKCFFFISNAFSVACTGSAADIYKMIISIRCNIGTALTTVHTLNSTAATCKMQLTSLLFPGRPKLWPLASLINHQHKMSGTIYRIALDKI